MIRKFFCLVGLHLHLFYHIKWIDHPEGKLGYWYCPTCLKPFDGYIHKPDGKYISGIRIRNVNNNEIKTF